MNPLQWKIVVFLAMLLALIILGPMISIWALNTLFPALQIPLTFGTWLAMALLGTIPFGACRCCRSREE